ncbi:subtilisin-like protein [Apiospora hydei]|uniref:Subtilisin-like protein n=1 Tax=Apiospora hydei TaxID=1337664 RepID=A0ABR1WRE8_9PEZI
MSHTGVRGTSPARNRPPHSSAPELVKPLVIQEKRASSKSPPDGNVLQSTGEHLHVPRHRESRSTSATQVDHNAGQADKGDGHSIKRSPSRKEHLREAGTHGSKSQASSPTITKTKQPPELLNASRKPTDEKQDRLESGKQRAKTPEPPAPVNASDNPSNPPASRPRRNSLPGRFKQPQFVGTAGALYDSKEGSSSSYGVDSWFRDLEAKTQALLAPLRTGARKRVKVAVLDTGIHMGQINHWDKNRADIVDGKNPRIKSRKDFLDPDRTNKCMDLDGHGTHCVGVIRKVAPEADVYVARVAKDEREGPNVPAIIKVGAYLYTMNHPPERREARRLIFVREQALEHACEVWNVDIISLSFGFEVHERDLEDAIQKAINKPILVLAATNNFGTRRRMSFPARMANVISMHAADHNGSAQGTNPRPSAERTSPSSASTWFRPGSRR